MPAHGTLSFTSAAVCANRVDESDGDFSSGDYSLREAIEQANFAAGPETINFSPDLAGSTIKLAGSEIAITDHLTLQGLGLRQVNDRCLLARAC